MLERIKRLNRQITSSALDGQIGQTGCFLGSAIVLLSGFYKLFELHPNEKELFFGILLVLGVSLLGVLIGLVLPLAIQNKQNNSH